MDPFFKFKTPSSIPKKRKSISIARGFNIEQEMFPEKYELKRKLKSMFPDIDPEVIENYVDKEFWREDIIDSPTKSKKKPPPSPYLKSTQKKKKNQREKSKELQERSQETAKRLF